VSQSVNLTDFTSYTMQTSDPCWRSHSGVDGSITSSLDVDSCATGHKNICRNFSSDYMRSVLHYGTGKNSVWTWSWDQKIGNVKFGLIQQSAIRMIW